MMVLFLAGLVADRSAGAHRVRRRCGPAGIAGVGAEHGGQGAPVRADQSSLWAVATTDASNGSVNSMHDSYKPLGMVAPMFNMAIGEVIFGGVGSGLYGMIFYVIIAVFIGGLMVGRTPEYLGKKIGAREVKLSAIARPGAVPRRPRAHRGGGRDPGGHRSAAERGTARVQRDLLRVPVAWGTTTARRSPGSRRAGRSTRSPAGSLMLVVRFVPLLAALALARSARRRRAPCP